MSINGGYNGAYDRMGRKIRQRAKQDWAIGETVKVGFMSGLVVMEKRANGDAILCSNTSGKFYTFTPHHGISAGVTQ